MSLGRTPLETAADRFYTADRRPLSAFFKMPITTTKLSKNKTSRQCIKHRRLVTLSVEAASIAGNRLVALPWTEVRPGRPERASTHDNGSRTAVVFPKRSAQKRRITGSRSFQSLKSARLKGSAAAQKKISGRRRQRQAPTKRPQNNGQTSRIFAGWPACPRGDHCPSRDTSGMPRPR